MQKRVMYYDELEQWAQVFTQDALDILIIEGSAGAGKSSIIKKTLISQGKQQGKDFCWLEGRITAVCLYQKLYEHRDMPIFLDDIDGLYRDKESVNLLKCLCQTENEKNVAWNTMSLKRTGDTPTEFVTKSKVCIITNSWKLLNKHVGAVSDRGLLIFFHPPAEEVHNYVKSKLSGIDSVFDLEVFAFIGENLGIIAEPSIRHYRNALQLKQANMPWQEVLIESFGLNDNEMAVLKLFQQPLSNRERASIFAKKQKKSERTFFRVKADLEARLNKQLGENE